MSRMLFLVLVIAAAGCSTKPTMPTAQTQSATPSQEASASSTVPTDLESQVDEAISRSGSLFEAFTAHRVATDPAELKAIELAEAAVDDRCEVDYVPVIVRPAGAPAETVFVYLIGDPESENGMMIGRHYRVEVDMGSNSALSVTPSTKGCLSIPAPENAVAAVTAHLLSNTPTEFHVFESLKENTAIYVATSPSMVWSVNGDSISILKQ